MRILLPLHGFARWNGGLDLIRLVVSAIDSVTDSEIELSFAVPVDSGPSRLLHAGLRQLRQIAAGNLGGSPAGHRGALIQSAVQMIGDRPLVRCGDNCKGILVAAETSRSDMIFPTMIPLGDGGPPRIGYLFDFQHKYLPSLFSNRVQRDRDRRFEEIANDADGIVVNSQSAARDTVEFLGFSASKILAMPFTPYALPHWFDVDPEDAMQRHGIRGAYFLICNHFWKHKDHATALRAFALLRARSSYADLHLVMTGDSIDHRDPRHYARLQELARELGVVQRVHFLGLIPKRDQLALIRGCKALLQPTLFEGGPGGGSVYEAVGLGVPAIVSDIPINLEIEQGEISFFKAGDAKDLAEKMIEQMSKPLLIRSQADLLAQGNSNLQRLGKEIHKYLTNPAFTPAKQNINDLPSA